MIRGVIVDLDGTVYFGTDEVPGARRFVSECRAIGIRCLFVTNRANREPREIAEQLGGFGIACELDDVLTAAQATASYLGKGSAWYIGEDGLRVALEEQGIVITEEKPDCVVVGYDRGFNYEKLFKACRLIDGGAKFIATNPDKALKTENGIYPGTGAIVAAVESGCGRKPIVIGKPERLIMDMALARLGMGPDDVIVVGDSLETDVPAGDAAGMRTVLMLTGVSRKTEIASAPVKPDCALETFEELLAFIRKEVDRPYSRPTPDGYGVCPAACAWIRRLCLIPHPEGGWYREAYRGAPLLKPANLPHEFGGSRNVSTAIYYLLGKGKFSAFHRIKSDELWHLYDGGPILIHCLSEAGGHRCLRLGREDGLPQLVVPAGTWFAAELADRVDFALTGCTVAPGFDFADSEMAKRNDLAQRFPQHLDLVIRLTR